MEARSIKPILVGLLLAALVAPTSLSHAADDAPPAKGTLRIFITDGESGAPSPARLEVLDASGDSHVPSDALPAPGECSRAKAVPWWNELSSDEQFPRSIVLPYTPTSSMHFYALENGVELQLKPGKYEVVAQKGP